MEGIFVFIFFGASICFLIGLLSPSTFQGIFDIFNQDSTRKNNIILWLSVVFISIFFIGGVSDDDAQAVLEEENKNLKEQLIDAEKHINTLESKDEDKMQEVSKGGEIISSTKPQDDEVEKEREEEVFRVKNVIDGDTIKLENGDVIRYIGINTPETKHPSKPQECFGQEASKKNEELVEGKEVTLVKDVSETDRYNRLLRYVYVEDIFVNDYLVKQGFANASSYPPDVKYQDQFRESEQDARENKRGLWADDACAVEQEPEPVTTSTPTPAKTTVPSTSSGSYACDCSKTCSQMSSCAEAQYQLNTCGCSRRDGDKDGIACDGDCQ
jgi:micrococcal nuclease